MGWGRHACAADCWKKALETCPGFRWSHDHFFLWMMTIRSCPCMARRDFESQVGPSCKGSHLGKGMGTSFSRRWSASCPTWAASGACGSARLCCLWWKWRSSSSTSWSSHSSCCCTGSGAGTGLQDEGPGVPGRWPPLQPPPTLPVSVPTLHPRHLLCPSRAQPLPWP